MECCRKSAVRLSTSPLVWGNDSQIQGFPGGFWALTQHSLGFLRGRQHGELWCEEHLQDLWAGLYHRSRQREGSIAQLHNLCTPRSSCTPDVEQGVWWNCHCVWKLPLVPCLWWPSPAVPVPAADMWAETAVTPQVQHRSGEKSAGIGSGIVFQLGWMERSSFIQLLVFLSLQATS